MSKFQKADGVIGWDYKNDCYVNLGDKWKGEGKGGSNAADRHGFDHIDADATRKAIYI